MPTSTSGAVWGSVSSSRTLWHADQGESNQRPSDNKTPALPLAHSRSSTAHLKELSGLVIVTTARCMQTQALHSLTVQFVWNELVPGWNRTANLRIWLLHSQIFKKHTYVTTYLSWWTSWPSFLPVANRNCTSIASFNQCRRQWFFYSIVPINIYFTVKAENLCTASLGMERNCEFTGSKWSSSS